MRDLLSTNDCTNCDDVRRHWSPKLLMGSAAHQTLVSTTKSVDSAVCNYIFGFRVIAAQGHALGQHVAEEVTWPVGDNP